MPGDQDIVSLGLDIDSFNESKKTRLREFIALFDDLAKYDGKIINPVLGDGLTKFNASIAQTNQLIDQMNEKIGNLVSNNSGFSSSISNSQKSTTELGLATKEYGKSADAAAVTQAKLAVSTSEQAKDTAALKVELAQVAKAILEEAKANNESIIALQKKKISQEEYRAEQQRVVATLRLLAIEQDRESKQSNIDATERKKIAAAEYRAEQQRVVAVLRQVAIEEDRQAAATAKAAIPFQRYAQSAGIASNAMQGFNVNAGGSSVTLEGLGSKLTHTLTLMRYLAYILPGLGIAGIFNLAFEAISGATQAIIGNTDSLENNIKEQDRLNKSITEQIDNYKELKELVKDIESIAGSKYIGGKIDAQIRDQDEYLSLLNAEGIEKGKILQQELELLKVKQKSAETSVFIGGTTGIASLKKEIDAKTSEVQTIYAAINRINFAINKGLDYVDPQTKRVIQSTDKKESKRDSLQGQFDAESKQLKGLEDRYVEYYKTIKDLKDKEAEIVKFNSDQERKLFVERSKDNISVAIANQKTILDNDKKFHDEKAAAIEDSYKEEKRLADVNRINVTGTKENPNVSATPVDIKIAINKENDDIIKAQIKRDKEIEKNDIEFYQRKIKALKDINKDETDEEVIKNEKIFQNEQNSLSDRLQAYQNYILLKQRIKDYEFGVEIQRSASKAGGVTSLTPEEKQSLETHRNTEQANITANSQKQVFDIVYSSLKLIIKETEDAIKTEEDLSKEGYTKALENLNEQYDKKKISLTRYHEERKRIDNKYQKQELDEQIKQDEESLIALKSTNALKIEAEVDYRRALLIIAQEGGNQTEIDKAKGALEAAEKAQVDINKDIKNAQDKLASDKLKRAKIGPDEEDQKNAKKWADQIVRIERKIADDIQKLHDERIEREIEMVQRRKDLLDQAADNEKNAVEVSELSIKDKHALEIQLQAEKQALALDSAQKEKQLKIEEFNFNKKIALANAVVGIAAAIIKDGLTTPKSIADAIIGTAEIGTILAEQPPSFKHGIDFLPFTMKARFGEDGYEVVKEPGKKPFIATEETIATLEKGTQIIPIKEVNSSTEDTNNPSISNVVNNNLESVSTENRYNTESNSYNENNHNSNEVNHNNVVDNHSQLSNTHNNLSEVNNEDNSNISHKISNIENVSNSKSNTNKVDNITNNKFDNSTSIVKSIYNYLPKEIQIIPLRAEYPVFSNEKKDHSWEQTRFLAKQIKNSQKEIKNIFKPTIVVDMSFENRKKQILGS